MQEIFQIHVNAIISFHGLKRDNIEVLGPIAVHSLGFCQMKHTEEYHKNFDSSERNEKHPTKVFVCKRERRILRSTGCLSIAVRNQNSFCWGGGKHVICGGEGGVIPLPT